MLHGKTALELLACTLVSGVLIFAAVDKAANLDGFINALQSYPLIGAKLARVLALPVILVETACAVALWLPGRRRQAAWAAVALLGVFGIAVAVQQWLVPGSTCGCWFSVTLGDTRSHLMLNLVLMGLAASVALGGGGRERLPAEVGLKG